MLILSLLPKWKNMPNKKYSNSKTSNKSTANHISKKIIMPVLMLILTLADFLLLTLIPNLTKKIIVIRSEIQAQEMQKQSAQKIISDLKATEEKSQIINASLPDKKNLLKVIELIEALGSIAKVQNFKFESEEPLKDTKGNIYLPLNLVLEGSLSQTMSALNQLEKSPYLLQTTQTLIESPKGLADHILVNTSLNLYVRQPYAEK